MRRELRRPLVVGNWKLFKTLAESRSLAVAITERTRDASAADIAVAPVFTALSTVRDATLGTKVALAAQDVYWESQGAFTGEVSAPLLKDVGCSYVIVGHSERRTLFGETDAEVRRKLEAVLAADMTPIVCVGESLQQREAGESERHVLAQVSAAVRDLPERDAGRLVIAYEPIWAIGTGRTASPQDAEQMQGAIRRLVGELKGAALADRMRILYGGSVKADNARALLAEPDLDGALVGGASLDPDSFAAIVSAAYQ